MDKMLTTSALTNALSNDDLMTRVPMAFATEPTAEVSPRYVFIPTTKLIDDMATMGWYPVLAKQKGKRANAKKRSSFHMIAFENSDPHYFITNAEGDDCRVRIIVTNSHDGSSSFTFRIGLFRLICENGLVISTQTFTEVSVRHIAYTIEQLEEVIAKATSAIPQQIEAMNKMHETELEPQQKTELAVSALKIRRGLELTDNITTDEDSINELLTPIRKEDEGNDLWTVFNILQEKIIKGGSSISVDGKKPRKMRGIKSALKDIKVNQRLFECAYSYANVA